MISAVRASQRLDSRGNPTVQVEVETEFGVFRALVPSGASTGQHEAVELRDKDEKAYRGKGVQHAIRNVHEIIGPALIQKHLNPRTDLKQIDRFLQDLDGTPNKARLGANAILGVSMACARAGAAAANEALYDFLRKEAGISGQYVMPVPFFNVLNGGVHSGNTMAFQEVMIAPVDAKSFEEAMRMGSEVYHHLKEVITTQYGPQATGIGDEGGFAPPITRLEQALDLLDMAIGDCGYSGKFKYAIDPASSEFFTKDGSYDIGFKDKSPNVLTADELQHLYEGLLEMYPIGLLEDPFAEDDWDSWTKFNKTCPVELVGDDLLVTNVERLKMARDKNACNSMLLKVNQIGTVSEAIEAAALAFRFGWSVFVSHRSGETTDDFIADLTVALNTGHLKSGAPCRGERIVKYNRLMDIESELKAANKTCLYAGRNFSFPSKAL